MHYSGEEIIEIAVRIEENGYAFYMAAAEPLPAGNEIKGLLLDLAEKEVQHIAIFQGMAKRFEAENFEFNFDDSSDYINHLASQHIFGKVGAGVELAKTLKTPKEALEVSLKFENDSVAFYAELEKHTESGAKQLLLQVLNEEKDHAAEIERFL